MVVITWNPPADSSRVDYYQYTFVNEPNITYNTTNFTNTVLSDIPYNQEISIVLSAINCLGRSSPVIYTFNTGKFPKIINFHSTGTCV